MKKRIGIQGFLIFLTIVVSILFSKFFFPKWKKEYLDEFLDAVGIGIILFGFLFRIAARGYKSERSNSGKTLITDGPYGLMRHPMYFGTLLIGLGVILVLFEWWAFPLFLTVFLLIYIPQVRKEERLLSSRFGQGYELYSKKIPNYFPKGLSLFKIDLGDYLFFKWSWVKKELVSLVAVMSLIIAAEMWEDVRLFGSTEYFKELIELCLIIIFLVAIFILSYKRKG